DLPNAFGDVALIKQVVVNLVSNAFKYSSKKDTIVINIGFDQSKENDAAYFIRDNGTGFKMEYHDKLFGVFNRLHSNNEFEGTGVGLAIVKRIINKHGGKIWAESEEGKGSTFFFSLPNS
ncbi:MAG: ATP-binding protein, partial [Balneola sp.]